MPIFKELINENIIKQIIKIDPIELIYLSVSSIKWLEYESVNFLVLYLYQFHHSNTG